MLSQNINETRGLRSRSEGRCSVASVCICGSVFTNHKQHRKQTYNMFRTRRTCCGYSSLPSLCDYGEAAECALMDDVSSSSTYEESDDIYPLREVPMASTLYSRRRFPVSSVWRTILTRTFFAVAIFGLTSYNLRSRLLPRNNTTSFKRSQKQRADSQKGRTLDIVHENIQHMSKAMILEKYGLGPHLVEFELNIWDDDKPIQYYFTIEMAPIHSMPTTVYYFLEQISRGLWDGTSFYLNADHVLAARPVSGNGQVSKREEFGKSGFGRLPFVEYNSQYPHLPYTLAYTGTSPAFYINKIHNTHHDEACFAQVVIGRSTINRIAAMHRDDQNRIRPVDIVAARRISIQNLNAKAAKEYLAAKAGR
jgi:Cyclophilin type peptidyl-prolyl cis-trans isomerase/CLD